MKRFATLAFVVALGAACSRTDDEHKAASRSGDRPRPPPAEPGDHDDEPEHASLPKRVKLEPKVAVDAGIKTTPVVRETLVATLELPGEISSDPDKTARVSALLEGRIESVALREGQAVKKGDVLAVIKVPELGKAKAAFAATAAKALAARSNADRLQALSEKQLAATQEVVTARSEAEALEAEARAAEEQLRALGTATSGSGMGSTLALRAPIAGVVVSRDAVVGQTVAPGEPLATIADLADVWFLARVFEDNLERIHVGAPAEIRLNAYPKELFEGSVEYLGKQIDPTARTVVARIRLHNRADMLRLGLFGVARVDSGDPAKAGPVLVVPRSAVTEVAHQTVVFVRQADGDFDLHQVVLGEQALGKVQILSGVREGEQVVSEGVFTLKSAILKGTFAEED